MSNSCVRHPMTFGTQICGECGHHFCEECVVFPFGIKKPPVCISCALEIGGVSARPTGRPKLSRQSIRERRTAQKKALKAARSRADQADALSDSPLPPGSDPANSAANETADSAMEPRWIEDSDNIDSVPGGWSQTYR